MIKLLGVDHLQEKPCLKCGKKKYFSKFYKKLHSKDGYYNICKECQIKIASKNNKLNRKKCNERNLRYYQRYPDKRKAQLVISKLKERNKITPENCYICGKDNTEAHHPNYEKPKLIYWLCVKHHNYTHRLLRVIANSNNLQGVCNEL